MSTPAHDGGGPTLDSPTDSPAHLVHTPLAGAGQPLYGTALGTTTVTSEGGTGGGAEGGGALGASGGAEGGGDAATSPTSRSSHSGSHKALGILFATLAVAVALNVAEALPSYQHHDGLSDLPLIEIVAITVQTCVLFIAGEGAFSLDGAQRRHLVRVAILMLAGLIVAAANVAVGAARIQNLPLLLKPGAAIADAPKFKSQYDVYGVSEWNTIYRVAAPIAVEFSFLSALITLNFVARLLAVEDKSLESYLPTTGPGNTGVSMRHKSLDFDKVLGRHRALSGHRYVRVTGARRRRNSMLDLWNLSATAPDNSPETV